VEPNLFRYIWRHSLREQSEVLALVALSLPFYFLSLNLPKLIVSGPIEGKGFEGGASVTYYALHLPGFLGGGLLFDGVPLDRVTALFALAFTFLVLVCVNGLFKFQINTMKGRMGERLLRRLRYELIDRVLRFPPQRLKRIKPSEAASMVKDEVEPLGGFVGEAFATPAFLGGQALTALLFIFLQNPWLGIIAAVIVTLQALIVPWLRKPILDLGRQRQLTARELSGRVGEIVDAGADIQTNDTSNWERAEITRRLGRIYDIRFRIYRRKFFVKFLNNFLAQVTPFFFYAIGGWYAIQGELSIGQLVAVITAYKDLPAPVKELLDWYLEQQDAQIKYEQVVQQFQTDALIDPALQATGDAPPLKGEITAEHVTVTDDSGAKLLDGASFRFSVHDHVAFAGPAGGGKDAAAASLVRLLPVKAGSLQIAGQSISGLPQLVTGRRIAYAGPEAYVFPLTIRENLLYGLRNEPRKPAARDEAAAKAAARRHAEDLRAANAPYDAEAQWIDPARFGGAPGLDRHLLGLLKVAGLDAEMFRFGLTARMPADSDAGFAAKLLQARALFRAREAEEETDLVEHFAEDSYNPQSTIGENLLFAVPLDREFAQAGLAREKYMRFTLEETGLLQPLLAIGREIAETVTETFRDLPAEHPVFQQFSFVNPALLPVLERDLTRLAQDARAGEETEARLLSLALAYVEPRHRLGLLDEALQARILIAHQHFVVHLPDAAKAKLSFYDSEKITPAASVEDNILFGRIVYGAPEAATRSRALLDAVIRDLDLGPEISRAGLDHFCGPAGKRLTPSQRQRLALARALAKEPCVLVVNGALSGLDPAAQAAILGRVLAARSGRGVVWTVQTPEEARLFARVIEFRNGQASDMSRAS
jgi:putative ABC transport system ATP-binding protein